MLQISKVSMMKV